MSASSPNPPFPPWLDEVLGDFSALGRAVYLDDPLLGLGHAALDDRDELGIPRFSPQIPQVPVALFERHQALWTHPDTPGGQQEVWTASALRHGMARIPGPGVQQLPTLDGWTIAAMGVRDDTVHGLALRQPDGAPFLYTVCDPAPDWLDAAARGWVLVLHGPQLGLRDDRITSIGDRAQLLLDARTNGLVTGGLVAWRRTPA